MRVLLDECVPHGLRRALPGHEVTTVTAEGWAGRRNGDLLGLMLAAGFQEFVTVDRNLAHQQSIAIAGIVLRARTNRERDLLPLAGALLAAIGAAPVGPVTDVAG